MELGNSAGRVPCEIFDNVDVRITENLQDGVECFSPRENVIFNQLF